MPIDSKFLKVAVMSYFRFERTWITATEVNCGKFGIADVLVDTGSEIIEIEIKRYKNDLISNELNKEKHTLIKDETTELVYPNRYFVCVPDNLAREAERFVRGLNNDYGLIVVNTKNKLNSRSARIVKHAKKLHDNYNRDLKEAIVLRLCSEIANIYELEVNEEFKDELNQDININRNFVSDEDKEKKQQNILEGEDEEINEENLKPLRNKDRRKEGRRGGDNRRKGDDYRRQRGVKVTYEEHTD